MQSDSHTAIAALQRQMQAAILGHAKAEHLTSIAGNFAWHSEIVSGNMTVQARLAIYRKNALTTHCNTLAAIYPVVLKIVGEKFFSEVAAQYAGVTPSRSGDLHQYGGAFAEFLAKYKYADSLVYLADIAKLEWYWHRAFHAADSPTLDFTALDQLTATRLGEITFTFSPSLALLASAHPLLQIWLANQPDYAGDWRIDWEIERAYFVLSRPAYQVQILAISEAQFQFLSTLRDNANLASALDVALAIDAAFDLPAFFVICHQAAIFNHVR